MSRLRAPIRMGLVLALLVLGTHVQGIDTGLFLDDHSHFYRLRHLDWSFRSAVESSYLGIVGEVLDVWNRHEAGLRFFRPIAFWTMKIEYTLAGWNPATMHVFSMAWHWLAALLTGVLAWRFMGHWGWATLAACMLALHPSHVSCSYWIASQTELQVAVWVLLATLAYARYASWPRPLLAALDGPAAGPAVAAPRGRGMWLAATVLCLCLALGCRENSIMLVPFLALGDVVFALRRGRGLGAALRGLHWKTYVLLGAVVAGYLGLRTWALGGFPLPGKPYLMTPADPGFVGFIIDKFALNVVALFGFMPIVPLGGLTYFRERPANLYVPFLLIVAVVAVLVWVLRGRRGVLLAPAWIVLMMLPLLPVFSSPHHLYVPSIGSSIVLAILAHQAAGGSQGAAAWALQLRRRVCAAGATTLVLALAFSCWSMGWVYRSSTGIEDLVINDVRQLDGRPLHDGDHLFFLNIPMMAYYVVPAIEEQTGLRELKGHALTFSPSPLLMDESCRVEQVDAHTLRVTAGDTPYFTGTAGMIVLQGIGIELMPRAGDEFDADLYVVRVERASAEGIEELTFRFRRPLSSPDFHFYLTSRVRMAYPLVFGGAGAASPAERAAGVGFDGVKVETGSADML